MKRFLVSILVLWFLCAACSEHASDFSPVDDVFPEARPPVVMTTHPADGAVDVPVNSPVTVTFSKPMDTALIPEGTVELPQNLEAAISWEENTLAIAPAPRLAYGTTYALTIPRGLKDTYGLATAEDHPFTFTTVFPDDTTPPRILATSPADGVRGVSVTAAVNITFSEPMDLHGIDGRTFTPPDGPPVRLDAAGAEITLTPLGPLEFETTYTLTIPGELTDLYDNPLGADHVFSFTTAMLLGELVALAPGPQPETLFALDAEHLYQVNVSERLVERRIPLPDSWPVTPTTLCCLPEPGLVCIGGESALPGGPGRRLAVYDLHSGSFTDFLDYSRTMDMQNLFITGAADLTLLPGGNLGVLYRQINLLPLLRETSSLAVVNPRTGDVLAETAVAGTELDVAGDLLVSRSPEMFAAYVLDGAVPRENGRLERANSAFALAPDGRCLFIAVNGGLELHASRDLGAAPEFHPLTGHITALAHSGGHLFALTAGRLHILSADGAEVLETRTFPSGTSARLAAPNSDGSVVTGFAAATDPVLHGLYFFPVPRTDGQGGMSWP